MKFFPLIDTRPSCVDIANFLDTHTSMIVETPAEAEGFFVGGGDGWMLDMMRKHRQYDKPFLGLNCGTRGFLLNTFDKKQLETCCTTALDFVDTWFVEVEIHYSDGTVETGFFLNDIALGGSVLDYFTFRVSSEEASFETMGTGLVVCTALGSTGYSLNLGQPMIPLKSMMRGISGIATAPFKYKFVHHQEITIEIIGRSPGLVGLDGYNETHQDIQKVVLRPSTRKTQLAFFKDQPFAEKRLFLSEEKLGR